MNDQPTAGPGSQACKDCLEAAQAAGSATPEEDCKSKCSPVIPQAKSARASALGS